MTGVSRAHLAWIAKSPWHPPIRREHFLAQAAVAAGHTVSFYERPIDVRAIRRIGGAPFARRLLRSETPQRDVAGVQVRGRVSLVPGHLGSLAGWLALVAARATVSFPPDAGALVVQSPWDWGQRVPGHQTQKIFDYSDDWIRLLPDRRRPYLLSRLRRVTEEADHIVVVSPDLVEYFEDRQVHVVPNGGPEDAIARHVVAPPGSQRMVYVGTLSERLDLHLAEQLVRVLDGWRLDLYGDCQYARCGDRPDPELAALLARQGRIRWHGPVSKREAEQLIDDADVCVIPHRRTQIRGQSSMKVFDYSARGRPTVATLGTVVQPDLSPPGYREAATAEQWVTEVTAAAVEDRDLAEQRVAWARNHTWESRWKAWEGATRLGEPPR